MKYIRYLAFTLCLFIFSIIDVNASYKMNDLQVNIELNEQGNAHITEIWDVYVDSGTELYKTEYELGNMNITNFVVKDESNTIFEYTDNWNINGSINEKKQKNGFYHSTNGLEMCWGMGSYGNHIYTISYDIENFVFNTDDSQVIYYRAIDEMASMPPQKFSVTITGPKPFSDTLDVWGYGYKGYAYVKDGKISMSNEENTPLSGSNYVVVLVKFPIATFLTNSENSYEQYEKFDDIYNSAEENTYEYNYNQISIIQRIFTTIVPFIFPLFFIIFAVIMASKTAKYQFGTLGRKIEMKKINMFRDIPCDKNIFKAFFVAQVYKLNNKNTDVLSSIFLKWMFEDKITINKEEVKKLIGSKEEVVIFFNNPTFETAIEQELFDMLKEAAEDNKLTSKELEKWCKTNYTEFFNYFSKVEAYGRDLYANLNQVTQINKGLGSRYMINDSLKEEAIKLAGLKKFLLEFSRIKEKEAIEVKLWKEYLMYAQIFGIADKVAKQFKDFYPEIQLENNNIDMMDVIILNNIINTNAVSAASSARAAAQSYSAGGGGFSSGGGGGGSFGGGGGAGGR